MKLPKGLLENLKQGEPVIEALKISSIASKPDWTRARGERSLRKSSNA
jgi:hypothetical protein